MKTGSRTEKVVVRGAGEMASGVIHRLFKEGYDIIALEQENPCCVRRQVCFAEAIYSGEIEIEGVKAKLARDYDEALLLLKSDIVPILIDPEVKSLEFFSPDILIDGRMLKRDIDIEKDMAELVIGLGPGFRPGDNCHLAIETNRGPDLGKAFENRPPQEDTAIPSPVKGFTTQRVLRSPANGVVNCRNDLGDRVNKNDIVAEVDGIPVRGEIDGILRGLCHDGIMVTKDQKIGDIDPRGERELCFRISDKARAIADGVLESIEKWVFLKVQA